MGFVQLAIGVSECIIIIMWTLYGLEQYLLTVVVVLFYACIVCVLCIWQSNLRGCQYIDLYLVKLPCSLSPKYVTLASVLPYLVSNPWQCSFHLANILSFSVSVSSFVDNTYESPCEVCECLRTSYGWNDYTTHTRRKPLPRFRCVAFIRQVILNSQDCSIRNGSATIRNVLFAFVWTNASKSLRMSYDHYNCFAINKNILRLLTK